MELLVLISGAVYAIAALVLLFQRRSQKFMRFAPAGSLLGVLLAGNTPLGPGLWLDARSALWVQPVLMFIAVSFIGVVGYIGLFRRRLAMERVLGGAGLTIFLSATPLVVHSFATTFYFFRNLS